MHRTPDEIKKGLECCITDNCKECPYYPLYEVFGCKLERAKDALALIQQREEEKARLDCTITHLAGTVNHLREAVPRWISVEERMPEDEKNVAVIVKLRNGNWMYLTAFWMQRLGWWINKGSGLDYEEITHWCPLPPSSPFGESTSLGDGGSGTT